MIRKNKAYSFIILMLLCGFTYTHAQNNNNRQQPPQHPSVAELFKMMDANEDNLLSKEEIKGPLKNDFDKVDTNEDGFISREELENAPKPERRQRPNN